MTNKISEENLSLALRFIVDNFGKNILLDSSTVNSILSDLVPKLSKQSKWIKEAIDIGIVKILLDENNIDDSTRKVAINKAKVILKEEHISQERIDFIINNIIYGLGWINKKVDNNVNYSKNINNVYTEKKEKNLKSNVYNSNTNSTNLNNNANNKNQLNSTNLNNNTNNKNQLNSTNLNNNTNNKNQSNNNKSNNNINPKDNQETKTKKYKKIITLGIAITLGIVIVLWISGIYLGNSLKSNNVYAKEVAFDIDYEKENSKYIFKEDDFIVMSVYLDGNDTEKIDESKLSYEVDDSSVCNISNELNRCRIKGKGLGETTIHIYYEGNEIKSVDLEFREEYKNETTIKEISIPDDYKVVEGVYTFKVNTPIEVYVELENSNDEQIYSSKIRFEVTDNSICEINYSSNICTITGIDEGNTKLNILYDDIQLKEIDIAFEKEYTKNEDSSDESFEEEYTESDDSSDKSIESDRFISNNDVDWVVKKYIENYSNAINSGDISYISKYIINGETLYNDLSRQIQSAYEKGTKVSVISYKKERMELDGSSYRAGYTIEYHVGKSSGEVYQKEYMEFIVVESGSSWYIKRFDNWKLLEQRDY